MKRALLCIYSFVFYLPFYGMNNMIDSIKTYICQDSLFYKYSKGSKIYVWKDKFDTKDLNSELYLIRKYSAIKLKTETIDNKNSLLLSHVIPLSSFKCKKTKSKKKWNGVWNMKNTIIKISDIYTYNDSMAYCLIRVFAIRKYIDYNFFLKKKGDSWVVDEEYVVSDFII